jgi:hypothetical protein
VKVRKHPSLQGIKKDAVAIVCSNEVQTDLLVGRGQRPPAH